MKKIFWGFFFVYLNFNLTINGFGLNLIPDFVGYILLYQAAGTLAGESGQFRKLQPFSVAMAIYTGILWVGELLGITGETWLDMLLDTVALGVSLYISWNVIQAILEIEENRGADLNGRAVRRDWLVLVIAQIVSVGIFFAFQIAPAHNIGSTAYQRTVAVCSTGPCGGHHSIPVLPVEVCRTL